MTQIDLTMIIAFLALLMACANAGCLWNILRKLEERNGDNNRMGAFLDAKDIEFTPQRKRKMG